jgi:hypothetical protein
MRLSPVDEACRPVDSFVNSLWMRPDYGTVEALVNSLLTYCIVISYW